jgi:hypothetical protein
LPHLELSLELNHNVLNSKTSPVQNPHGMPYAALPSGPDGLATLFLYGYHGMLNNPGKDKEGKLLYNPSYPKYVYQLEPRFFHSDYGTFLMAYYKTVNEFIHKVIAQIPPAEYVDIMVWANYVKQWVPEFPSGDEIFEKTGENTYKIRDYREENLLAKAISSVVWDLSVGHAADHYDYSTININHMPFCIRIPPPASKNIPPFDRKAMVRWSDIFKHKYERQMFFIARNVTLLKDVRYNFNKKGEDKLRELNDDFLKALRKTEEELPVYNYIPLDQIARSIQY